MKEKLSQMKLVSKYHFLYKVQLFRTHFLKKIEKINYQNISYRIRSNCFEDETGTPVKRCLQNALKFLKNHYFEHKENEMMR